MTNVAVTKMFLGCFMWAGIMTYLMLGTIMGRGRRCFKKDNFGNSKSVILK
jgi:hypothetical protein